MNNPGPGTYSPKNSKKGPKYTMRSKKGASRNLHTAPGPGQYNSVEVARFRQSNPEWTMAGKNQNMFDKNSQNPSPNDYNLGSTMTKNGPKFGKGERRDPKQSFQDNPPPWNYEIGSIAEENIKNNKGKTIGQKLNPNFDHIKNPAPGTYQPDYSLVKNNAPESRFGSESRHPINSKNDNPPPTHYNPSTGLTKTKNPAWDMGSGTKTKFEDRRGNPGPGTYEADNKSTSIFLPKF